MVSRSESPQILRYLNIAVVQLLTLCSSCVQHSRSIAASPVDCHAYRLVLAWHILSQQKKQELYQSMGFPISHFSYTQSYMVHNRHNIVAKLCMFLDPC